MNTEAKTDRSPGPLQYWAVLSILVLMLPSFYWIANDHHPWPWDQAWYGEVSADLWFKFTHHVSEWFPAMATAFETKSPGIAWFGQFFVPLGRVIGSIDTALLFFVVATQIGSIALFYKSVRALVPRRPLVAAVGILLFAGAPLFVGMSHQYVAEALQLFGITYFYFLAATGHRMQRMTLAGNLLLATAIALLAKMTSPIYCLLPGMIATYVLIKRREPGTDADRKGALWGWVWLIAGAILFLGCATWYIKNLPALRQTLKLQTSLEFTLDYGRAGSFFEKLSYWLRALRESLQFPWVIAGQFILIVVGSVLARIRGGEREEKPRETGQRLFNLLTICSLVHILAVLCLCSSNYNEETRYLLPLLPAIGLVNIWLVSQIRHAWLIAGVMALLLAQWAAVCAQALGLAHLDHRTCSYWVIPLDKDRKHAEEVVRIVRSTEPEGPPRYNIVGIDLPWLSANTLSFFAAKEQLKAGKRSFYTSLGYGAKDMDPAWKRMSDLKIEYYISLEETAQPPNPNFLNLIAIPALQRVRNDPEFVSEPFKSDLGVLIFRKDAGRPNGPPP